MPPDFVIGGRTNYRLTQEDLLMLVLFVEGERWRAHKKRIFRYEPDGCKDMVNRLEVYTSDYLIAAEGLLYFLTGTPGGRSPSQVGWTEFEPHLQATLWRLPNKSGAEGSITFRIRALSFQNDISRNNVPLFLLNVNVQLPTRASFNACPFAFSDALIETCLLDVTCPWWSAAVVCFACGPVMLSASSHELWKKNLSHRCSHSQWFHWVPLVARGW